MSLGATILITAVVASALGLLIGWLLGRGGRADSGLADELKARASQLETQLNQARGEILQNQTALATAQANQTATEKILTGQKQLHEQTLRDAKAAQERALTDLRDTFKALSADALKQSAPEFLRLAEQSFGKFQETAKGDLAQRQEAIKGLVEPLKQQLETYQKNLQSNSAAQSSTLGEVKKQLELLSQQSTTLAQETQQFRLVLHSNQARGKWGEETLRRVVEISRARSAFPRADFFRRRRAARDSARARRPSAPSSRAARARAGAAPHPARPGAVARAFAAGAPLS